MSSTNFRSILTFASCIVGTCNMLDYMGEFSLVGGVLFFVHYNGKCWYFYTGNVGIFITAK